MGAYNMKYTLANSLTPTGKKNDYLLLNKAPFARRILVQVYIYLMTSSDIHFIENSASVWVPTESIHIDYRRLI